MAKSKIVKKEEKKSNKSNKSKRSKKVDKDLSLWVYDENCNLDRMTVPIKYRMDYVSRFGTLEITTKEKLEMWLTDMYQNTQTI